MSPSGKLRRTEDGILFASAAEMEYYVKLRLLRDAGQIDWFLTQPGFNLGTDPRIRYRADFLVHAGGNAWAVEVKGFETPAWRRTVKLWKKYGPMNLHVIKGGQTTEVIESEWGHDVG